MPRLYFNFSDGIKARDDDGEEFATIEDARRAAITSLMEISRNMIPAEDFHEWIIDVQDESNKSVLQVKLAISVRRPD